MEHSSSCNPVIFKMLGPPCLTWCAASVLTSTHPDQNRCRNLGSKSPSVVLSTEFLCRISNFFQKNLCGSKNWNTASTELAVLRFAGVLSPGSRYGRLAVHPPADCDCLDDYVAVASGSNILLGLVESFGV